MDSVRQRGALGRTNRGRSLLLVFAVLVLLVAVVGFILVLRYGDEQDHQEREIRNLQEGEEKDVWF